MPNPNSHLILTDDHTIPYITDLIQACHQYIEAEEYTYDNTSATTNASASIMIVPTAISTLSILSDTSG